MKRKNMFGIAKRCLSMVLAFCLALTGIVYVNAEEQASQTYYVLDAEPLQWNYQEQGLWRSERMNDGYVGVWSEMELVPGANYAVAVTVTAPVKTTISPMSDGTSIIVFRKNAVTAGTDGVRIAVFHNNTKIYPTDGTWAEVGEGYDNRTVITLPEITMEKGDQLRYIIDNGGAGNNASDSVYLHAGGGYSDITGVSTPFVAFSQGLAYTDAASGNVSAGFGDYTKSDLVSYESVVVNEYETKELESLTVENGDFEETGKDVPGWSLYAGELDPQGDTLEISTDTAYTGSYSLKLTSTRTNDYPEHGAFSTPIMGIQAGYTYKAKAMLKGDFSQVVFHLRFFDMYCHYLDAAASFVYVGNDSSEWFGAETTAVAPAGAAFARIYIQGIGKGTFYADTVSLAEMPLLINSAFEEGTRGWTAQEDGFLSDSVKVQGGLSYALTGSGKETNSTATLMYYDAGGAVIQQHTETVGVGEHMAIQAYAPANATTLKVKVSGSNAFAKLSLKPAPKGTQVADSSFESLLNGTGKVWSSMGSLVNEDFEGADQTTWSLSHYRHAGELSWTTEKYRSSATALKLDTVGASSGNSARSMLIPVEAGLTYDVSVYFQSDITPYIMVEYWPENPSTDAYDGSSNRLSAKSFKQNAVSDWTEFVTSDTAPVGAKYMTILFNNNGEGTTYVDDLVIKQSGALTGDKYFSKEVVSDGETGIVLNNNIAVSQLIPVLASKEYVTVATVKGVAQITVTYLDKNNSIIEEKTVSTQTADTEELLRLASVAPLYAFNAKITLKAENGNGWFDGVDMYAVSDSVSNASFEDVNRHSALGNFPNQWRIHGEVAATAIGDYKSPDSAMKLQVYGVSNGGVYSSMICSEENTTYMARIMASSEQGGSLRLAFFDKDFKYLGCSAETEFSGQEWKKYTVVGTSPAQTAYTAIEIVAEANEAFSVDAAEFSNKVIDISNNTQMFIDDYMIETTDGLTRTFHQGKKSQPVQGLKEEAWEVNGSYIYGTVLYDKDEEIFKMWYQSYNASNATGGDGSAVMACYATSTDGVNWVKPNLGLVSYAGNTNNNIVGNYHIQNVFKDYEETNPAKRYKMISYLHDGKYSCLYSADGIHWTKEKAFLVGNDVITANWDASKQQYYAVLKLNTVSNNRDQYTMIGSSTGEWNVPMMSNSLSDVLDTKDGYSADCYGMGLYEKDGNYIGFNWQMCIPGYNGMEGVIDVQLAYSRDLTEEWQRPTRTPILSRGVDGSPDDGCLNTASSAIEVNDEVWMYYCATDGDHGTAQRDFTMYIAKWRMDGFASLDAKNNGVLQTKQFTFDGNELHLNADASNGEILVEVLDANGDPIQGYTKEDCVPITTDSVKHVVSWENSADVSALEGEAVSLRIYAENSSIYSFEFAGDVTEPEEEPETKYFEESFENGLSEWPSTNATVVTKVAHSGASSLGLNSDATAILNKSLDQSVNKVLTIWFYDDASKAVHRVFGGANLGASNTHHLSLGVSAGDGVATNKYTLWHAGGAGHKYTDTGITRTTGWHQFVFDATSGERIDAYIDGVKVGSITEYTAIQGIKVGWHKVTTGMSAMAFDDITVTDKIPAYYFYEESFENGLSAWPSTNATAVTKVAHSGASSLGLTSDVTAVLNKSLDQSVNKVLTIWFYDDASKAVHRVFGGANLGASNTHHLSLGVSAGDGVATNVYTLWHAGGAGHKYTDTGITRTTGWHQFVFDATSGARIDAYIDGVKVGSITEYTAIQGIKVGWHKVSAGMSAMAFDDITVINSMTEVYNLAQTSSYVVEGTAGEIVKVNQQTTAPGTALQTSGDYIIFRSGALNLKYVVLYRAGDAQPDNKVDVRDLIAVKKKVISDIALETKAGELGADVDGNGSINDTDIYSICDHIIGLNVIAGYAQ